VSAHRIYGSEAPLRDGRDIWAGMLRFVRSGRRARVTPSFWVGVAWAVLPSLIGGALFLAVVGLCAGLVP
jgi:hypothetical protein